MSENKLNEVKIMGFFKNLIKQVATTKYGTVTGSDFGTGYVVAAHKEGAPALGFMVQGKDDYIFVKSDIAEISSLGSNVSFAVDGNLKVGNKYRIAFNDGKSAIMCIVLADCAKVESIIY